MKTIDSVLASALGLACLSSVFYSSHLVAKDKFVHSSCVAHRGYSAKYLENSPEAFLAANAVHVPGIEFDVMHSKDGVAIVHHDKTPERTARSKKGKHCALSTPFAEQTFSQIRDHCELQNGENIPSLSEVFQLLKPSSSTLFVELKDKPSPETLELIKTNQQKKVVMSFTADYLDQVAQSNAQVPLIFLTEGRATLPDRFDGLGTDDLSNIQLSTLRNKGKLSNIWTVNDRARIRERANQGIDYITTDEVELCMEEVAKPKKIELSDSLK